MEQFRGRSPEGGGDGGDAWMESGVEEGLRWRKPVRRTPGRWGRMRGARAWTDETNGARGEKKISAGRRRLRFNRKRRRGGGLRGGRIMEAERERERGAGAAWRTVGLVRQWRTAGSVRRRSTWLTGGPRRYGGPVVDRWGR
jgi:hypothetical protein